MFSSLLSQSLSKTQSPLSPAIFYAAEYLMIRLALGISSCLTLSSTSYHANWMSFRLLFCFPEVSVCSSSKFHVISLFFKVLYFSSLLFIIHQQVFPNSISFNTHSHNCLQYLQQPATGITFELYCISNHIYHLSKILQLN